MQLSGLLLFLAVSVPSVRAYQCEVIQCSSKQNKKVFCSVSANHVEIVSIELVVKNTTNHVCIGGESFGHVKHQMWVDKGCSSEFFICYNSTMKDTVNKICKEINCTRSSDGGYRECNVSDILGGNVSVTSVSLLETFGSSCFNYVTYGFYDDHVWVYDGCSVLVKACYAPLSSLKQTDLTCESKDDGKVTCILVYPGTISSQAVQEQRSTTKCIFPKNSRFELNKVVIEKGCVADFRVHFLPEFDEVECASVRKQLTFCNTGRHLPIKTVSLVQESSNHACFPDLTFGWEGSMIWTDAGCAGTFNVRYDL